MTWQPCYKLALTAISLKLTDQERPNFDPSQQKLLPTNAPTSPRIIEHHVVRSPSDIESLHVVLRPTFLSSPFHMGSMALPELTLYTNHGT